MENKNKYTKPEASRVPLEISNKQAIIPVADSEPISKNIPQGYAKTDGTLSPALVFIISGGEKKEKDYFSFIAHNESFPRIKIEFVSKKDQGLTTRDLLIKANQIKENPRTRQIEGFPDSIYLLSDVDHFYQEIVKIKPECEKNDFTLIVCNPCFELWLYYSYFSEKPNDFSIPSNPKKISQDFKTYSGTKIKGGINPRKAIFNIKDAIINAKSNYEIDDNDIPKLFSTNMFVMAKNIFELITPELEHLKTLNSKGI